MDTKNIWILDLFRRHFRRLDKIAAAQCGKRFEKLQATEETALLALMARTSPTRHTIEREKSPFLNSIFVYRVRGVSSQSDSERDLFVPKYEELIAFR